MFWSTVGDMMQSNNPWIIDNRSGHVRISLPGEDLARYWTWRDPDSGVRRWLRVTAAEDPPADLLLLIRLEETC